MGQEVRRDTARALVFTSEWSLTSRTVQIAPVALSAVTPFAHAIFVGPESTSAARAIRDQRASVASRFNEGHYVGDSLEMPAERHEAGGNDGDCAICYEAAVEPVCLTRLRPRPIGVQDLHGGVARARGLHVPGVRARGAVVGAGAAHPEPVGDARPPS